MTSLEGSIVDLVTPFERDGIDERCFTDFVAWQIAEGTHGLVTGTTTGEGPALTAGERQRLIEACVEVSAGRIPVIAATGTNGTDSTIALTRMAQAAGADAALIVTPYYNRPSQEGLYRHFEAVARAVSLPIILHNVPSRTGVDLLTTTVGRLSQMASIAGLCDQSGDPLRPLATARVTPDHFVQLCGDDARAVAFNLVGGRGCISAVANPVPGACALLQRACLDGRHDLARDFHRCLAALMEGITSDVGPAPVKTATALVRPGFETSCRPPMVEASVDTERAIKAALRNVFANLSGNRIVSGAALGSVWEDQRSLIER